MLDRPSIPSLLVTWMREGFSFCSHLLAFQREVMAVRRCFTSASAHPMCLLLLLLPHVGPFFHFLSFHLLPERCSLQKHFGHVYTSRMRGFFLSIFYGCSPCVILMRNLLSFLSLAPCTQYNFDVILKFLFYNMFLCNLILICLGSAFRIFLCCLSGFCCIVLAGHELSPLASAFQERRLQV